MNRFLIIILLLGLTPAGCRKNATPAATEPRVANEPAEYAPAPSAIIPPEPRVADESAETARPESAAPPKALLDAERNFEAGNYRQAAQAFERFLYTFQNAPDRDRALFHFGFSLALSGDDSNLAQTEIVLHRLISEFPKSPYRKQAEWIIGLKTQIERLQADVKVRDDRIRQLNDELRKLKSIDLERRPSRPE